MEHATDAGVGGVGRVVHIIVLHDQWLWIRFAVSLGMRSTVLCAVAPTYTVWTPCGAYETIVTVAILANKRSPSLKLWVVLCILHVACVADADRQTIAAEERLAKLGTDAHALPSLYGMADVLASTLQVVVVLFVDDELLVGALAFSPRVGNVAALVVDVEEIIVAQRVALVPESVSAIVLGLVHHSLRHVF